MNETLIARYSANIPAIGALPAKTLTKAHMRGFATKEWKYRE